MPTKAEDTAAAKAEIEATPARRTTRTAAQFGAGGGTAMFIAWLYEKVFHESLDVQVAIFLAGLLTSLATWIQNVWDRRRDLKALKAG